MNEIDFDELDKAVSSLMNKNQKRTDASADNAADSSTKSSDDIRPTIADEPQPVSYNTAEPESSPVSEASNDGQESNVSLGGDTPVQAEKESQSDADTTSSRSNTVPHRAGRFMDVKHDSSNMRSPAPSVSRQGNTIQPASEEIREEVEPLAKTSDPEPAIGDPWGLDYVVESKPADVGVSRFLTAAMVEKRPLGRPKKETTNENVDEDPEKLEPSAEKQSDENVKSSELDSDEPVGMPEELQPDLVSIEADTDTEAVSIPDDDQPAQETEDKKPKVDLVKELGGTPEPEVPTATESVDGVKPTGPVSIPQQYKESPSSQPQDNGTIYDTENYHQPISHPAKKSSGWMIVVWILLIILLGASLGAAAYFSGMI